MAFRLIAHHPRGFKPAGAIHRTAWLLLVAALLTSGPAAAQRALPSAEALYEVCSVALDVHGKMEAGQIQQPPNLVAATRYGQCFGYITGAMEALALFQTEAGKPYFCLPPDLRNLDVARQFHEAFREAPEMADWSPRFAIFMTLAEYACAEARPMTPGARLGQPAG
jgi:Rap1a immunity proteins